jgi:hypothetical protein
MQHYSSVEAHVNGGTSMARIICFSDFSRRYPCGSARIDQGEHTIHLLSASRLNGELRETVARLMPILFCSNSPRHR